MEPTKESIETTENFYKALEELAAQPTPEIKLPPCRLVYDSADGTILKLTEEQAQEGETWVEVNRKEFEAKHGPIPNIYLRYINGEVVKVPRPSEISADSHQLTPGDTWQADNEYRLITGEPSVNTSGWSRKTD